MRSTTRLAVPERVKCLLRFTGLAERSRELAVRDGDIALPRRVARIDVCGALDDRESFAIGLECGGGIALGQLHIADPVQRK